MDAKVHRCTKCDEYEVVIPRVVEVHETIAQTIIMTAKRFGPKEARFLRTFMGYSKDDFATELGVRPDDVAAWEASGDQTPVPREIERKIQLMYLDGKRKENYDEPARPDDRGVRPLRLVLDPLGWHPVHP